MIRVLQEIGSLRYAGVEAFMTNFYLYIDVDHKEYFG